MQLKTLITEECQFYILNIDRFPLLASLCKQTFSLLVSECIVLFPHSTTLHSSQNQTADVTERKKKCKGQEQHKEARLNKISILNMFN